MLPFGYISLPAIFRLLLSFNLDEPTSKNGIFTMKKHILLIVTAAMLMSSCVKEKLTGVEATKTFDVPGWYDELSVSNNISVSFSDQVELVTVTADEGIISNFEMKLVEGELKMYRKQIFDFLPSPITVLLPCNAQLREVNLSGTSSFNGDLEADEIEIAASGSSLFKGNLSANEIDVSLSGGSSVTANRLIASKLDLDLSGGSSVTANSLIASKLDLDFSGASWAQLNGSVENLELDFTGASELRTEVVDHVYAFACMNCESALSGASKANLHCDGRIYGSLSGGSEIRYTGNADTENCHLSGGSKVIHKTF